MNFLLSRVLCIFIITRYIAFGFGFGFGFIKYKKPINLNKFFESSGEYNKEERNVVNPLDCFPESVADEEILEELRQQNQISNDLWQSTHFRDNHCGQWNGNYEIFTADETDKSSWNLKIIAEGDVNTKFTSDYLTKDQESQRGGVEINFDEKYEKRKIDVTLDQYALIYSKLTQPLRKTLFPTQFRLAEGNQAVGGSYTLVTEYSDKNLDMYLTEIAIRDGSYRVRGRYLYLPRKTNKNEFEFSGVMIIREQIEGTPNQQVSPFSDLTLGSVIYDPQAQGELYEQFNFPGKITLFFPKILFSNSKGVLTIQWDGIKMRYQADRKFPSLESGRINTLELTEIMPQDAIVNYFQ